MTRFVRMFKPRFAALVRSGAKLQTVHPVPNQMPAPGDILDAREWARGPYRWKQIKIGEFEIVSVDPVVVTSAGVILNSKLLLSGAINRFAKADGFESEDALIEWFRSKRGIPFTGIVIYWKP